MCLVHFHTYEIYLIFSERKIISDKELKKHNEKPFKWLYSVKEKIKVSKSSTRQTKKSNI